MKKSYRFMPAFGQQASILPILLLFFGIVFTPASASPADSLTLPNRLPLSTRWAQPTTTPSSTQPRWGGSVEIGGLASSSGVTPFWLQTNQYGAIPKTAPTGLLRINLNQGYRDNLPGKRRKTDFGYGVDFVGQLGSVNQLLLVEGYLKARWGVVELFAGRRRQRIGLAESTLSSGSYIWSGNTLPIPQVQIGLPEYTPIGFTKGWVALKGFIAHGWFGNDGYVQGSFLHQKALYLRLGRPQSAVRLYGAFTHFSQWGGYAPFLERDPTSSFNGQLAQSWDAFVNVLIPMKTDALKDRTKFTTFDQNRVGDHRGSAEMAVEIKLAHGLLFAYQQHFYDLGRKLYNFRNIEDGLYGVRFLNKKPAGFFQEIVVELFNSGNQGVIQFGRYLGGEPENYFLNGQYPASWSYQGRTIGTPLMSQSSDVRSTLPSIPFSGYTNANQLIEGVHGINNNRVWALHGGFSANLGHQWGLQSKVTYSKNYGTFSAPFPVGTNQLSTLASLTKSMRWLSGSTMQVSLAYDQGQLLPNAEQYGGYIGFRKYWGRR